MEIKITPKSVMMGCGVIALAAVGLACSWAAPMNSSLHEGEHHYYFLKMLMGLALGFCAGTLAWRIDWRQWLKSAPFVVAGWMALLLFSKTQPLVKGHWGWISFGCVRLDVQAFAPVALALLAGWIACRCRIRSVWAAMPVAVLMSVPWVMSAGKENADLPKTFMQEQCVNAIKSANWFGGVDDVVLHALPESMTTTVSATSAVLFGKWSFVLLVLALLMIGVGFALAWKRCRDESARAFILILGTWVIVSSALNLLGCVGLVPIFDVGIPFVSYGMSMSLSLCLGLGIMMQGDLFRAEV